jgi:hypothetical protein
MDGGAGCGDVARFGRVGSSPFKGEAGRGMGFVGNRLETHRHPEAERDKPIAAPLEGEGAMIASRL